MIRFVALAIVVVGFASSAHAQTNFGRTLDLTLSPEYPAPGETVRLSIQTYALDLNRSEIVWFANEREIARGDGLTETTILAGAAGTETTVNVTAEDEEGLIASATAAIRPAEVDLLWEADSYVHPFYEGRVLPGTASTIRAQALARFQTANGLVPESNIVYTWYRNNAQVTSGRGKSSASLPGPALFGTDTIRVVAVSADGKYSGAASARIFSVDPFPVLYENHPLFGVLFHRALEGSANTLETEQKMTAVPYFAGVSSLADPSLIYEWRVGNTNITPDAKEPQTLTLAANGYQGPVNIELALMSASDIAMRAVGAWELIFGRGDTVFTGINPFGGTE